MKIGIISDIHANADAMRRALRLLAKQGAQRILCAGDLVDRGSQGDAVIALIKRLKIPCVRGNHDEDAPGNQRWLRENADLTHPNIARQLLSADTIAFLQTLPFSRRYRVHDTRILLVHGTPQSNVDYLLRASKPKKFRAIATESGADVILYGHTHHPLCVRCQDTYFFNPGSVTPAGSHTCGLLSLPDCDFRVFEIGTGTPRDLPLTTLP